MEKLSKEELEEILKNHQGKRADLSDADLTGADLPDAILTCADLTDAILTGANLAFAD